MMNAFLKRCVASDSEELNVTTTKGTTKRHKTQQHPNPVSVFHSRCRKRERKDPGFTAGVVMPMMKSFVDLCATEHAIRTFLRGSNSGGI